MAALEETSASRYVKLGKEQDAPVEDIRPGELNQPVHVPQVVEQFSSVRSGFLWILFFPPDLYYGFDLSQVLSLGLVLWIHPDLLWIWIFSCSYLDFWGRGLIWMRVRAMHYTAAAWSSEREWPGKNSLKIDVARISSHLLTKHSFTQRYVWILIKL